MEKDASTDGRREFLQTLADNPPTGTNFKVLLQPVNGGKGAALRGGLAEEAGDLVMIQDTDLEYDPADYSQLLAPLLTAKADVVYGSRFAGGEAHRVLYFWPSLGNRFLRLPSNASTNLNLAGMECRYKVFRREAAKQLTIEENRFGVELS